MVARLVRDQEVVGSSPVTSTNQKESDNILSLSLFLRLFCNIKIESISYINMLSILAGETRFEHATYGFGDRYSTVEPLPYSLSIDILH